MWSKVFVVFSLAVVSNTFDDFEDVFESASTPEPDDYFTTTPEPCNCDPEGSESQECNSNGICDCKPWFTGDNCDPIKKGAYHTFTIINRMLIHTGA